MNLDKAWEYVPSVSPFFVTSVSPLYSFAVHYVFTHKDLYDFNPKDIKTREDCYWVATQFGFPYQVGVWASGKAKRKVRPALEIYKNGVHGHNVLVKTQKALLEAGSSSTNSELTKPEQIKSPKSTGVEQGLYFVILDADNSGDSNSSDSDTMQDEDIDLETGSYVAP